MKKGLFKISSYDLMLCFLVFIIFFVVIPTQKYKIKSLNQVTMTDSLGVKKFVIVDLNSDGVADYTQELKPRYYSRPTTKEEQQYFLNHKNEKTP